MAKIIFLFSILMLILAAFYVGKLVGHHQAFRNDAYFSEHDLHVDAGPIEGKIPAGATLYLYRELPEITTYVVLINLKERDILKSAPQNIGLAPLPAFIKIKDEPEVTGN